MTKVSDTFARIGAAVPPSAPPPKKLGTAVVLGGSIAGMLAARVLADHAERVVILERDDLTGSARPGVPHGNQAHVLLVAGAQFLDRWFPGFIDRAVAAGACPIPTERVQVYDDGVPRVNGSSVVRLGLTRPFLET